MATNCNINVSHLEPLLGTWSTAGKFSLSVLVSSPIAPGPVSELHYIDSTDTSVNITWKPPKEPNGVIVAYFVEYGVHNKKESLTSVEIDARSPMQTVIQELGT